MPTIITEVVTTLEIIMIKNYTFPFNAINADGSNIIINTLDELKAFNINVCGQWGWKGWSDTRYSYHWVNSRYRTNDNIVDWRRQEIKVTNTWIVRDFFGKTVKFGNISEDLRGCRWASYNRSMKKVRDIAEKGLPIPRTGCRKAGWKQNAPAKKNSGKGHRRRNVAKAIYESAVYEIPNKLGNRIERW